MAWLNGRIERQLVTALLLLALLVSCGIAGRAQEATDPTAAVTAPTAEPEPSADAPSTAEPAPTEPTAAAPAAAPASLPPAATPPVVAAASPIATPTSAATATTRAPSTSPLATKRMVTYYGHPASERMGILGEFDDPEAFVAKLKEQTAAYTAADPARPGVCTIELIASVAQNVPGNDNLWLIRTPKPVIERYSQLAEKHGCLLLLDIQFGYDTIQEELATLMPFLSRPHVHLAIDPEFKVERGETPGESYGSVSAAEVAYAGQVLGDLVRQHSIPDKVLVVHQFRDDMLPDKANIKPMPNVDLVLMMDGWGGAESKIGNYTYFVREQLIQHGGIKLFYRQDDPVMTPAEILELDPKPLVVCYQ